MSGVINTTSATNDIKNISKTASKHDRNTILNYIRANTPITQYQLAKNLGINYTSIYQICKEFHFCGLIEFKLEIGDNNRTHKLILIPNSKEEPEVKTSGLNTQNENTKTTMQ